MLGKPGIQRGYRVGILVYGKLQSEEVAQVYIAIVFAVLRQDRARERLDGPGKTGVFDRSADRKRQLLRLNQVYTA